MFFKSSFTFGALCALFTGFSTIIISAVLPEELAARVSIGLLAAIVIVCMIKLIVTEMKRKKYHDSEIGKAEMAECRARYRDGESFILVMETLLDHHLDILMSEKGRAIVDRLLNDGTLKTNQKEGFIYGLERQAKEVRKYYRNARSTFKLAILYCDEK